MSRVTYKQFYRFANNELKSAYIKDFFNVIELMQDGIDEKMDGEFENAMQMYAAMAYIDSLADVITGRGRNPTFIISGKKGLADVRVRMDLINKDWTIDSI